MAQVRRKTEREANVLARMVRAARVRFRAAGLACGVEN
jgi:hypothetical protein